MTLEQYQCRGSTGDNGASSGKTPVHPQVKCESLPRLWNTIKCKGDGGNTGHPHVKIASYVVETHHGLSRSGRFSDRVFVHEWRVPDVMKRRVAWGRGRCRLGSQQVGCGQYSRSAMDS